MLFTRRHLHVFKPYSVSTLPVEYIISFNTGNS